MTDTIEILDKWYPYLLKSWELRKEDISTDLHKIALERGDLVSVPETLTKRGRK